MQLRPITMEDYPAVLAWSKDEVFCSYNGWESNRDPDELYQWWRYCVENKAEDFVRLGIEWDGRLVGYADLVIQDAGAEIGIAIGESSSWGKGIGSRAVRAMIDYARDTFGITTFLAETHLSNERSRRMLDRLGFQEISRDGNEMYQGEMTPLIQYKWTWC